MAKWSIPEQGVPDPSPGRELCPHLPSPLSQTYQKEAVFSLCSIFCDIYCCNENPIYVFLFWELRGLSTNFHIHVSVSDLHISRIGPHIFLQQNKQTDPGNIRNLSQIYECRNWETEHYNSVLEITVSFLGIHNWEPFILESHWPFICSDIPLEHFIF